MGVDDTGKEEDSKVLEPSPYSLCWPSLSPITGSGEQPNIPKPSSEEGSGNLEEEQAPNWVSLGMGKPKCWGI